MYAVGTNTPSKPSEALGALTTPSESIVLRVGRDERRRLRCRRLPLGPVTLNSGAYPCPIRYTFTESTDSGWLTWMS